METKEQQRDKKGLGLKADGQAMGREKQENRYTLQKVLWLTAAIVMMGLSNGLLVKLDLGQNPCAGFCLGLGRMLNISLGSMMLYVNGLMLIAVIIFDRKQIGLGMAMNMIFVGYISDFSLWLADNFLPAEWFEITLYRYALLVPVLAVFTVSVGVYLAVKLGEAPYDAIPVIIGERWGCISYRTTRLAWDLFFVVAGTLLGVNLGIVTLLLGFLLAPVISIVERVFEKSILETSH